MNFSASRRRALAGLGALGAASLAGMAPRAATAHEYPEAHFTVIHPWVPEAKKGTEELSVSMRIIQIARDDLLIGAETTVGELELWVPAFARRPDQPAGIPLRRGRDLTVNLFGPHFVLLDVNTDLFHGAEFPMRLFFKEHGEAEVALIVGED
jgi:copper(I)-binding protein